MNNREYDYLDTHYGRASLEAASSVERWVKGKCKPDISARYGVLELYECYCRDTGKLAWPAPGSVSVALFSKSLLVEAGKLTSRISRRRNSKTGKTDILGLQPLSLVDTAI